MCLRASDVHGAIVGAKRSGFAIGRDLEQLGLERDVHLWWVGGRIHYRRDWLVELLHY